MKDVFALWALTATGLSISLACLAWVTVLPTIGLLWLLGALH